MSKIQEAYNEWNAIAGKTELNSIPPTEVGGAGYTTAEAIDELKTEIENSVQNAVSYSAQTKTDAEKSQARSNINSQEKLVSGVNIKTINGTSILGSGNIVITGGNSVFTEENYNSENTEIKYWQDTQPGDITGLWWNPNTKILKTLDPVNFEEHESDIIPINYSVIYTYNDINYRRTDNGMVEIGASKAYVDEQVQNNKSKTITITYANWSDEKDANGFYMCDIGDDDLIVNTGQMIVGSFSNTQSDIVAAAEFQPTEKIFTGVFRLYAKSIPTEDLTFTYKII